MWSAYQQTGLQEVHSSPGVGSSLEDGTRGSFSVGSILHPRNPLVVFGIVLGVTVGLIGVMGSVRVGPVSASVKAD